ncbi:MAG: glycosyltransferase [Prevotella sp.]|nr:glycosyltransferase [Prevotella sp.]
MIFAHDKGRLCNNILQYGHVYAWGREHGRATMSMRFAYKYRYFKICHTARHNFIFYVMAKYGAKWGLIPVVRFDEPDADYSREEQMMAERRNVVAEGWYARWYDLFLKYKQEIVSLFAFDEKVMVRPETLMEKQPKTDLKLGMHIRRGDYKEFYDGRFFYSDQQYISLIRQFLALHPQQSVQIFICGSERSLDRNAYKAAFPEHNVLFPQGNPGEDLYLLSRCDYLIGPPSTFSLVASMYRDVPLYWVEDADKPLCGESFKQFDYLFQHIY